MPTLEHDFAAPFWRWVAQAREAGFDNKAIARALRTEAARLEQTTAK